MQSGKFSRRKLYLSACTLLGDNCNPHGRLNSSICNHGQEPNPGIVNCNKKTRFEIKFNETNFWVERHFGAPQANCARNYDIATSHPTKTHPRLPCLHDTSSNDLHNRGECFELWASDLLNVAVHAENRHGHRARIIIRQSYEYWSTWQPVQENIFHVAQ